MTAPVGGARRSPKAFLARRGGASRPALQGVDLTIAPAEIVALVGQSGPGKSTLVSTAVGLERPDAGRLLIEGRDVTAAAGRSGGASGGASR